MTAYDFNGTKTVLYQWTHPDYAWLSDIRHKHAAYLTASPLSQCGLDQALQGERYQATTVACDKGCASRRPTDKSNVRITLSIEGDRASG